MIRVITCDEHSVLRRGIREVLSEAVDIRVCGEAGDAAELKELLRTTPCDVLIMELALPGRGGLDLLTGLSGTDLPARVLVFSAYPESEYAIRCLKAGAFGFLSKTSDARRLVAAVRSVARGQKYITRELAQVLADNIAKPASEVAPHHALSDREMQTLTRIAAGKRLSEIAQEFMLSPKTVSVYRTRVRDKLNLPTNAALTAYAIRNHLV
ncbi:MAG: response regulator transcription factor [Comamonadaceae bacterium]|nr:MAG: response regulator transcription factor [Comamonadaceae bacterium]